MIESYIWRARFRLHDRAMYMYVLNSLAGAHESYIWQAIPVFVSFTGANIYLEAVSAGVRQLETYSGIRSNTHGLRLRCGRIN